MATPIDRLIGLDALKDEVDDQYKKAKLDAEDFLANLRDTVGSTSVTSVLFGEEAGEFKYGKTRKKKIVEFNVDESELEDWINLNPSAAQRYAVENTQAFAEWWFEQTGELADGVSRVEYEQPPTTTAPKIYGGNRELVKKKLLEGGNILVGASQLLLGDGDE